MGLTHYWQRQVELPEKGFTAAVEDLRAVVAHAGIPLAGFSGTGEPVVEPDRIVFNGESPRSCEPFEIHRVEFDRRGRPLCSCSCKTGGLPYDLVVKSALVVLKHHLGKTITVRSDASDEDWEAARRLVQQVTGYGTDFRLDPTS